MRSPVVVTNTASVIEADLLVGRLRSQGIDAVARTNLDRTTYGGLGGAMVLVGADQQMEAELELILLGSGIRAEDEPWFALDVEDGEVLSVADEDRECDSGPLRAGHRTWVRACGYVTLVAMSVATLVPSVGVIWHALTG